MRVGFAALHMAESVMGFGRRPSLWARQRALGPSSESRQGRNPREIGGDLRCRYGDLSVVSWARATGCGDGAAISGIGIETGARIQALLLFARSRRGRFADLWYAREAVGLFRPIDQLAQAWLSGERCTSS